MSREFSIVCSDELEILHNRLVSINNLYIVRYEKALTLIKDKDNIFYDIAAEEVENFLSGHATICERDYLETMKKIQRTLGRYL